MAVTHFFSFLKVKKRAEVMNFQDHHMVSQTPYSSLRKNLGNTKIRWNKNLLNNFQKGGSHTLPYLSAFWNDFGNTVFFNFNSVSINTVRLKL